MASLSISNIGTTTADWTISGLSNPFNTTYYIKAGVATSSAGNGDSSAPSGVLDTTSAPSSGTSTSADGSISGLSSDTTYTLYGFVQAANGLYYGSGSDTFTTDEPPDTTSPTQPSVKTEWTYDDRIALEWYECFDSGSGMSNYTIQIRRGGSTGTIIKTDNNVAYYAGQTGLYDTSNDGGLTLSANTTYYFKIGAEDNAGNISYGYWETSTEKEALSIPSLSATSTLTKITATCGSVSNADSYTFTCSGQTSQNRTTAGSVTFTGLTPGVEYTVGVKAEGSGDYSDSSYRYVEIFTKSIDFDWTTAEESLFNNNGDIRDLPYTRWNDMVDAINLLREDNGLADVSAYISSGDKALYADTFNLALNGLEAVKGTIMSDVSSGNPVLGQYFIDLRDAILATG